MLLELAGRFLGHDFVFDGTCSLPRAARQVRTIYTLIK
jgi:hypothetical protein